MFQETCHHHWIIEPPQGPTSSGICKFCSETRTFKNSLGTVEWNDPGVSYPSMNSKVAKSIASRYVRNQLEGFIVS